MTFAAWGCAKEGERPMLTGLHFVLSYRCTHQCDHCFVHSGPGAPGTFTLDQLRRALAEAVRIGTVERVYYEGGEPFLYYPLLLEGLRAARASGFEVGVVTNAYWAETEEDAEIWLRPLAEIGVADLSVSDDALHHGEGDESPARRALRAAERLGIPGMAICTPAPEQGAGVRFRGRAADKLTSGLPLRSWREFVECPDEDFADPGRVHLDAYGNVHLCQGILMGNMWRTPLSELVSAYDPHEHPVVGPLHRGGPAALAIEHGLEPEPEYVSACHLCYRIRERLLDRFPDELGPSQVYGRAE
jgi:hypothetical protein